MNSRVTLAAALLTTATSVAQVVPTTPTDFATRKIGNASSGTTSLAAPAPQTQTTVRHIAYLALGDSRQWTSSDGKPLVAKLIAWEQSEQVTPQGQPAPEQILPELPNGPTVVRDDKIRLLVNGKPFELPLARLSEPDQAFVAQVAASVSKPPVPAPHSSATGTGTK